MAEAATTGAGPRLYYVPKPNEMAYYDGLFAVADTQGAGHVGGAEAVRFFQTSGLPVDALKTVWTVADQPASNALDKRKFAVAVRLIQLLQNQTKGEGASLEAPEGVTLKPVYFAGVSGVKVNLPPPLPSAPDGVGHSAHLSSQQAPPPQPQQSSNLPHSQPQQPYPQHPPVMTHPPQVRMTPPRPPVHPPAPEMSTALTQQDPFVLTPSERSRYESLFPTYAAKDGYVYGPQAVELFSKSGLPQSLLAAIWNMVDVGPVDNRLDALEFAMAMHLIVCVSKKNLPMPAALPYSMKILKDQYLPQPPQQPQKTQQLQFQPQQQQQQKQQLPSFSQPGSPASAARSVPTPPPPMMMMPNQPPSLLSGYQQPPATGLAPVAFEGIPTPMSQQPPPMSTFSSLPSPPPLTKSTGMNISDAFEGLSASGGVSGGGIMNPTLESSHYPAAPMSYGGDASVSSTAQEELYHNGSSNTHTHHIHNEPSSAAAVAPSPVPDISFSSPPPKSSKQIKESYMMSEASEELVKVKAVLQKLQAENIALKASMGSLSEEEKDVQNELHAVVMEVSSLSNELTSLRASVLAAKSRLLEATAELKANHETKSVLANVISEAKSTVEALNDAYAGVEEHNLATRARAAAAPSSSALAPGTMYENDLFGFDEPIPVAHIKRQQQEAKAPSPVPNRSFDQDAISSSDSQKIHRSAGYESYGSLNAVAMYASSQGASASGGYGLGTTSSGYNEGDGIMGGAPTPLPTEAGHAKPFEYSRDKTPSVSEIAALKEKLMEAQEIARSAEATKTQAEARAEEIRKMADEAEETARKYQNQPDSMKKKGLFGKKKIADKDPKETERLALEAKDKKDQFLEAQSNVNDARKLVSDTKNEAEKLRKQIEDLELQAASMASLQQMHQISTSGVPPEQNGGYIFESSPPDNEDYGGFGGPMGMGVGGTQFKIASTSPPATHLTDGSGYGISPLVNSNGFNSNVMGSGGGLSIPEPSDTGYDAYLNPFGE